MSGRRAHAAPDERSGANLFRFMFVRYCGIEVFVGILLAGLWLLIYETPNLRHAIALAAVLYLLRFGSWSLYLWTTLGPIGRWQQTREDLDEAALLDIDRRLHRLSNQLSAVFVLGWLGYFLAIAILSRWVFPEAIVIGRAEMPAAIVQALVTASGAMVLYSPMTRVMLDTPLARLDDELVRRGLSVNRPRIPVVRRLLAVGTVMLFGPLSWYASIAWLATVQEARERTLTELRMKTEFDARDMREGASTPATAERVSAPPLELEQPGDDPRATRSRVDPRREHVTVAVALQDGSWLVAHREVEFGTVRFVGLFSLLLFIALVWGLAAILVQAHSILQPLHRLGAATRRMVEVGDLRVMHRVPLVANDEIGDLSEDFNRVLRTFEELANAVEAVAAGDLSVSITGVGDLSEAFTAMIEQLHQVVTRLRETSVSLAYATAQIQAASGEQELATGRQDHRMRELESGMDSLADLASKIDDASTDVLANAERALDNTDQMATQIRALGERVQGIDTLLEQIREIADRSDLLALNGSLEATRAGESGRGFSLVSAEMRRLAERVTGTVTDVRALITDIDAANASTVLTTERSRELTEQTAGAARNIASLTRQQSEDSERASTGVREVAEILLVTSVATQQTRKIAEDLQAQAATLERQLANFKLRANSPS